MEPALPDPKPPAQSRGKRWLKIAIRVVVGFGVLGFVILRHPEGLIDHLTSANPFWLGLAFASIIAGLGVSALRWRVYLQALDLPMSFGSLFRLYFVGTFFNAFLPTGIGGDAYKAIRIGRDRGSLSKPFASVFLDRFAGILGLAGIGFGSTLALVIRGESGPVTLLALVLSGGVVVAALLVLLGGDRLAGLFLPDRGIFGRIRKAIRDIESGGRARKTLVPGITLGVIFQMLVLGYHMAIAESLGISINIAEMSAIVVIASLATMIPITINGLGFRESSYKWGLTTFTSATPALGTAFAILVLGVLLASSLVGGLVYIVAGGEVGRAPADAGVSA